MRSLLSKNATCCQVAFEMGKTYNGTKIQKEVYYTLREQFNLPSQMACNIPRQVGATYKALRTKLKQNEEAIKAGRTNYTSQACPCCGHTSKENRPNKGLTFVCQPCGYTLHADLVGARNVALRVLLSRQEWESTGRLSAVPDASGDETKTDYRLRYSGLRWSQDAIPNFNEVTPHGGAEYDSRGPFASSRSPTSRSRTSPNKHLPKIRHRKSCSYWLASISAIGIFNQGFGVGTKSKTMPEKK